MGGLTVSDVTVLRDAEHALSGRLSVLRTRIHLSLDDAASSLGGGPGRRQWLKRMRRTRFGSGSKYATTDAQAADIGRITETLRQIRDTATRMETSRERG